MYYKKMNTQLTAEGFVWDSKSFDYEKFYNELMVYKEEFGDLLVPARYVNKATGYKLGQTVSNIRTGKTALDEWNALSAEERSKTNKPYGYFLPEDKYQELEAEGFVWEVDRSFDYDKFHNELMAYKGKFGDLVVPQSYVNKETGYKLGISVNDIRTGKKALDKWNRLSEEEKQKTKKPRKMILKDEEYQQLEAEGFVWDAQSFDYEKFYNELMIYKDKFGDLAVPWNYVNKATGYRLGQTVSSIRQGKKRLDEWDALSEEEKQKTKKPGKMILKDEEYQQLEAEGFVWDASRKKQVVTEQELSA